MKNILISLSFLLLVSCGKDSFVNNCFENLSVIATVNLNNAEFVNLQVPGSSATTTIQGRNIIIIRRTTTEYKAFDLECPQRNCSASMTFDGLKLNCSCHNKEYNSLNGSPIDGEGCFALEYLVNKVGSNTLQIIS